MMLLESTTIISKPLIESTSDGFLRLRGIVMQAESINKNGRIYPKSILEGVVKKFNEAGQSVMGELEHPNALTLNLERVSHLIEELEMVDNDVVGCIKVLDTPCGRIVRGLIEGGAEIGASSRGGGDTELRNQIDEVTDFDFVTIDLVGSPSAHQAYPQAVTESVDNHKQFIESIHTKENQKLLKELLIDGISDSLKCQL